MELTAGKLNRTGTQTVTQDQSDCDGRDLDFAIDRDLVLLRRVADGDRFAFHELFEAYYHRLFRFSARLLNDRQLVEEVVNDTMLVIWRKAASFNARSRVSTWIFGIAYRLAMKALAARQLRARVVDDSAGVDHDETTLDVASQCEDAETRELLESALLRLPPEHQAVLRLACFMGYSCAEIAAIVECPVNTVKTRLFKARSRLKVIWPTLTSEVQTTFQEIIE